MKREAGYHLHHKFEEWLFDYSIGRGLLNLHRHALDLIIVRVLSEKKIDSIPSNDNQLVDFFRSLSFLLPTPAISTCEKTYLCPDSTIRTTENQTYKPNTIQANF